jgi:hypothetical protein
MECSSEAFYILCALTRLYNDLNLTEMLGIMGMPDQAINSMEC